MGIASYWGDWAASRTGLYYVRNETLPTRRRQRFALRFFDFESRTETELFHKEDRSRHQYLAVSPDERWILYGEAPYPTSELMLLENFR